MWRCEPFAAMVPARDKISQLPLNVIGAVAPANRSRAGERLPIADSTKAARHDRFATSASRASRRSLPGTKRSGSVSINGEDCTVTSMLAGSLLRP